MRLTGYLLAFLLLAGWSGASRAACTLSGGQLGFGTVSTFDVREQKVPVVSGSAGLGCNGSIISVVTSNYARARATSAGGFRLRDAAGNAIRYRLSADAGGKYPLSGGASVDYFDPVLLDLLGILSSKSFAPTLFATVLDAPNIPAGTYTDTVTIDWTWQVCHGVGAGGLCILAETGSGSTVVTVTLTAGKDCRVVAPDIDFGSAPLVTGFAPVRQAVTVDCSLGLGFSVGFTSGTAGVSRPWRAMKGAGSARLEYNLFRPDGAVWDEAGAMPGSAVGTGNPVPALAQVYTARINPAQPTPPAGSYNDAISVVITF